MSTSRARRAIALSAAAFLTGTAAAQSLVGAGSGSGLVSPLGLDDVEITPDQRYAVIRENNSTRRVRIHDLATGVLAGEATGAGSFGELMGACLDGVAVTNTRAVVLGVNAMVLDLTNLASPLIAEHPCGTWPRDVEITPDGTIAAVRGGTSAGANGLLLLDVSNGALLASAPGQTTNFPNPPGISWNVDAVAVSDQHAVFLSTPPGVSTKTRVTIFTLHPAGGGPPAVTFETIPVNDMFGAPHDVAMSPDGLHAAVRSELAVAVFDLSNPGAPSIAFGKRLFGSPGPFDDTAMDSVEITNDRVVTISRVSNPTLPQGAQVDFFDMAGTQRYHRIAGEPHDLAITPDGTAAVVRTSEGISLYSIASLGSTPELPSLDHRVAPSAGTFYFGGLDSVAITDRSAVTLAQSGDLRDTIVHFWHIAGGQLDFIAQRTISNSRPIDLALTADRAKIAVAGNSSVSIFHVETGAQTFDQHQVGPNAYYQWCDGVAASADKIAAIGQWGPQNGWFVLVDATPFSTGYCTSNPNSSGRPAIIRALGDASVSHNNLKLFVEAAPASARGRFVYGTAQQQVPFGDGYQCVGGSVFGLRLIDTNVAGAGFLPVNYLAQQVPAGIIQPGSNWNFQFVFFDPQAPGFGLNSSDALSITFAP